MWNRNLGKKVDDSLAPTWPGSDPWPGAGIAGKVAGYETRPSKEKGEAPYALCHLTGAVTFTPRGPNSEDGDLVKSPGGKAAVIVGAWLSRLMSPEALPVGSYVQVVYLGKEGRAKSYELRIISRDDLGGLWGSAQEAPPEEERNAKAAETRGDDDLPF